MEALASAFAGGAFRELKWLSLGRNPIGNAGVAALAAAFEKGALPAQGLWLYKCEIGDEGMKALAAGVCGGLSKLGISTWRATRLARRYRGARGGDREWKATLARRTGRGHALQQPAAQGGVREARR